MVEKEQTQVPEELVRETEGFWNDPQKVMILIDLLFLWDDREQICS